MRLVIGLFDLIKFEKLLSENDYLSKVVEVVLGGFEIDEKDVEEVSRLLDKNRISLKMVRIH